MCSLPLVTFRALKYVNFEQKSETYDGIWKKTILRALHKTSKNIALGGYTSFFL